MSSCVLCPKGSCPSDCPALDLFPSGKEESKVLATKVMIAVGFKTEFIKDCLRAVKMSGGGLAAQKEFMFMIILGHKAMCGGETLVEKNKVLAEIKKANAQRKELKEAIEAEHKIHEKLVKDIVDAGAGRSSGLRDIFQGSRKRKCSIVMDDEDETSRGD